MLARKSEAGREEALAADLVVDASGRGSRTPAGLAALGFPEPEESVIKVDIGYATALVRPPATPARDWKALFGYMRPPETRLGVIVPVENGMWMVTLVGWFGDHPPSDPAGFVDFARSLPTLELYEAIRDAEICSPIAIHKFPANRRRRYERLARFPEGLAVIGDALTSFNPIYGQGMTTAALGASTLDLCLRREQPRPGAGHDLTGFSRRFQKRLSHVIDVPWMTVTGEDFRYVQARGPPSRLDPRAQLVYRSRLSARAPGRARVAEIPAGHASHETPGRALRAVRAAPGADAAELAVAAAHRSRAGSRGVSE
jgi:2-polyprenyl-6-methoxyphenol hydroxylase-like FAD-dependent oxidoreductase